MVPKFCQGVYKPLSNIVFTCIVIFLISIVSVAFKFDIFIGLSCFTFQGGSSSLSNYTEAELRAMGAAQLGLPLTSHMLPGALPGYPHPVPG